MQRGIKTEIWDTKEIETIRLKVHLHLHLQWGVHKSRVNMQSNYMISILLELAGWYEISADADNWADGA